MKTKVNVVESCYVLRSVSACLHRVQNTSDATLQSALFTWVARIQKAQCLVHVEVTHAHTHTQPSAAVISPESQVAVIMVAIVSGITLG